MLVHQASAITARLGNSYAILIAELVSLLHQLLHLLHDGLVLLLILLLVGHLRLLLLVAWRIVRHLLLRLLWLIIPRIGDFVTADGASALLLLGLSCGLL